MVSVIFFEKPGCGNNTKQKHWLVASGHIVLAMDLLKVKWQKDELRPFFGDLPVALWFNPSAPRIKSGEVDPAALDADTALAMMIKDPLLIRRPLIKAGDMCRVGFDAEAIRLWIGLNDALPEGHIEACPNQHSPCPAPEAAQ